jgi:hypothetical protein
MNTLADKIVADTLDMCAAASATGTVISAQRLADKFIALTEIVKAYAEGKTSAEEVSAAQNARSNFSRLFRQWAMANDPAGHWGLAFVQATLVHEMCEIIVISKTRFGTRKGMTAILADPFLSVQFCHEERVEIKKIADAFFGADQKLGIFMHALLAKYGVKQGNGNEAAQDRPTSDRGHQQDQRSQETVAEARHVTPDLVQAAGRATGAAACGADASINAWVWTLCSLVAAAFIVLLVAAGIASVVDAPATASTHIWQDDPIVAPAHARHKHKR